MRDYFLAAADFGPEHPDTLTVMNNLTTSYHVVGRRDEALKMQEEVLDLYRKVLGPEHVDADAIEIAAPIEKADELLAVHEALDALAEHDARKAELVKLRYFVGLTIDEAAEVLGVSAPAAKRDWTYARAFLFRTIQEAEK